MRSAVLSQLRRAAVVASVGVATTVALGLPSAQAADVTVGPFPSSPQCVSSQGTNIVCLQGTARVQLTEPSPINDNTVSATLTLDVYCVGSIGCTPLHQVVSLGRTGLERGAPVIGSATLITIPGDMLCIGEPEDQDCVPGVTIPISGPTVDGTIATVWIDGDPYPIGAP